MALNLVQGAAELGTDFQRQFFQGGGQQIAVVRLAYQHGHFRCLLVHAGFFNRHAVRRRGAQIVDLAEGIDRLDDVERRQAESAGDGKGGLGIRRVELVAARPLG